MLTPHFEGMPSELKDLSRWVTWKGCKVPYDPRVLNRKASSTDPGTWGSFEQARTAFDEGGFLGVGFALNGDGIVGVDLDKCIADDGTPHPEALHLLDRIGCQYVELSPSGRGLRGFGHGPNFGGRRGRLGNVGVELYASKRYLTVTGRILRDGPLVALPGLIDVVETLREDSYRRAQKNAEDDISNLPYPSVGNSEAPVAFPSTTLPKSEGERNRCLFELARHLRGLHPKADREELRTIAQSWHAMVLPVIGTKEFSTTWADFLRGWDRVRFPHGSVLGPILEKIDHSEPLPKWITDLGYGRKTERLAQICRALQVNEGDKPFFYPPAKLES